MQTLNKSGQQSLTPHATLERLLEGNRRFRERKMIERGLLQQVEETSGGQFPCAVILTCIDSRTPPELVFDQGLGDVFSVRLAGNVVNEDALGSMEFACKVAGAKLVLVVGHTHCGAVKGACDGVRLENLTYTMEKIEPVVARVREGWSQGEATSAEPRFVQAVARENVGAVREEILRRSSVLREMCEAGEIEIAGALYDVESGGVELVDSAVQG